MCVVNVWVVVCNLEKKEVSGVSLHQTPACGLVLLPSPDAGLLSGALVRWSHSSVWCYFSLVAAFLFFPLTGAGSLSGEGLRWCMLPLELVFRLRVLLSVCGLSPWGSFHWWYSRRVGLLGHRPFDLSKSNLCSHSPPRPPGSLLRSFSTECDAERSTGKDVVALRMRQKNSQTTG